MEDETHTIPRAVLITDPHERFGEPKLLEIVVDGEDTSTNVAYQVYQLRGPEHIIRAALDDPPQIVTRLIWTNMTLAERMAFIEEGYANADSVVSDDMTAVFPEKTLRHLSAWQYLVNTGAVWHANGKLGQAAGIMIDDGFLLHAIDPTIGFWGLQRDRESEQQGKPGTRRYVEAMMGPEYLAWLQISQPTPP